MPYQMKLSSLYYFIIFINALLVSVVQLSHVSMAVFLNCGPVTLGEPSGLRCEATNRGLHSLTRLVWRINRT